MSPDEQFEALGQDGFFVVPRLIFGGLLAAARAETGPVGGEAAATGVSGGGRRRGGVRRASARFVSCRRIAESGEVRSLMHGLLGDAAVVTRSILFDKGPGRTGRCRGTGT